MTEAIFSAEEIERYARHIVLRGVGGPGQEKLKAARVLVIGAGGLGAPLLHYLAAAGVGTIGIVDDDVVALSNLQRQVMHATPDIGRAKVEARRRRSQGSIRMSRYAAHTPGSTRPTRARWSRLRRRRRRVGQFRHPLYRLGRLLLRKEPLVTAAVGAFDGSLTVLRPYETGPDGEPNPTYRCLFPEPPPKGIAPACAETGVLGALTGILGSMMALEAMREIVGFGESLVGRLVLVDACGMRFETLRYGWDAANPLNGTKAAAS